MKFKKFLLNLVISAILAVFLAPKGYALYQDLMQKKATAEWANSFVPQEVSPYQ